MNREEGVDEVERERCGCLPMQGAREEMKEETGWISRAGTVVFRLSIVLLAVSGLGQMPIFKRYYLADIPGLGWLADFALLHLMHYFAAAAFLIVVFHRAALNAIRLRKGLCRLGPLDWSIVGVIGIIVVTGMMRVLKNFPWFFLTPGEALFADLVHLGAVVFFGVLVLIRAVSHSRQLEKVQL